ncbi:MAG: YndJ family transporter [Acidobacteria bacterium]|nr:YndJ family transporter [Acidobacteriota bacterium]
MDLRDSRRWIAWSAAFGLFEWGAIAVAGLTGIPRPGLGAIEVLFLLAPLVAVPLAMIVAGGASSFPGESRLFGAAARWQPFAAALVVVSFRIEPGRAAGILTLPWLAFAAMTALTGLGATPGDAARDLRSALLAPGAFVRRAAGDPPALCASAGLLFLPVGAAFLLQTRAGIRPMGFVEPIVLLTAVHFHFTAALAPIVAAGVGRLAHVDPGQRGARAAAFRLAATAILSGPVVLAAGWVFAAPRLKLTGALLVTAGHAVVAAIALTSLSRLPAFLPRALLAISSASALGGMALAALYAAGEALESSRISIPQMARWHGVANGVGFVLCGLAALALAARHAGGGTADARRADGFAPGKESR